MPEVNKQLKKTDDAIEREAAALTAEQIAEETERQKEEEVESQVKQLTKKQRRKKRNKKGKRSFWVSFLQAFSIFVTSLIILCLVGFLIIKPQVDKLLKRLGLSNINELISLYKDLTKNVKENDVVTHGFEKSDYALAKAEFLTGDENEIDIFDVFGNVDPTKIDSISVLRPIMLSDKGLAAIIGNALEKSHTFYDTLGVPLLEELTLKIVLRQIEIKEVAAHPGRYSFTIVGRVNLTPFVADLGVLGGLMPTWVWAVSDYTVEFDNGTGRYEIVGDTRLTINQMKKKSHNSIIKILRTNLNQQNNEDFTLNGISKQFANSFNDFFIGFADRMQTEIFLGHHLVCFNPKMP